MADIDVSVYLNAARDVLRGDGASEVEVDQLARIAVNDPPFRVAVAAGWRARGEHDAAAIGRVRELAERWVRVMPGVGDGLCGAAILAALDSTTPPPSPEGEGAARPFVECQLPVGWEWCALPIGHAGQCDPRPTPKEGRAANALTRPDAPAALDGGQPDPEEMP